MAQGGLSPRPETVGGRAAGWAPLRGSSGLSGCASTGKNSGIMSAIGTRAVWTFLLMSLLCACNRDSKPALASEPNGDGGESAEAKVYSPQQLRTALAADTGRAGALWGQAVTVKGVALSDPIATNSTTAQGIKEFVSVELADQAEGSGLGDVECLFKARPPGLKKGDTVTVTGTPDKTAPFFLLSDCAVQP